MKKYEYRDAGNRDKDCGESEYPQEFPEEVY
jgi:hypothetical protein